MKRTQWSSLFTWEIYQATKIFLLTLFWGTFFGKPITFERHHFQSGYDPAPYTKFCVAIRHTYKHEVSTKNQSVWPGRFLYHSKNKKPNKICPLLLHVYLKQELQNSKWNHRMYFAWFRIHKTIWNMTLS